MAQYVSGAANTHGSNFKHVCHPTELYYQPWALNHV